MADVAFPPAMHAHWKSAYLERPADAMLDIVIDYFARVPSPNTAIVLEHNGDGAIERVPGDATSFGHRRWPYNFVVSSSWADPSDTDRNVEWTRALFRALTPHLAEGRYVNYLSGDEGEEGLTAAYEAGRFQRLALLKAKYDPANVLRMNQNVRPAAT